MDRPAARIAASARRTVLAFLIRCFAYWGIALAIVTRVPRVEETGVRWTLATLQAVLRIVHVPVQRYGSALYVGHTSVEIVSDCSPHMAYLIFAAVVLAFPASWRARLVGLVAGAVIIHLFNTVRILALIGILSWHREWFDFAHVYLWQTGTVLVVFATFALWLRWLSAPPARATA
jgi:exosortase/archaeosortase family protein